MKKLFALLCAVVLLASVGCCGSQTSVLEDECTKPNCSEKGCQVPYQEIPER